MMRGSDRIAGLLFVDVELGARRLLALGRGDARGLRISLRKLSARGGFAAVADEDGGGGLVLVDIEVPHELGAGGGPRSGVRR